MAKYFNINVNQKFTRKEIDIVYELDLFCKAANIQSFHTFHVPHYNYGYYIDYYIPTYKIAIEIDEFDHVDRDKTYEVRRQKYISKMLGCEFIRCNPDDPNFSISGLIGKLHFIIINK